MTTRLSIDDPPHQNPDPVPGQQEQKAIVLCLQEGLCCNAVAVRLGLTSSSLAHWMRQARIDRGQADSRIQGLLSREECTELNGSARRIVRSEEGRICSDRRNWRQRILRKSS